MSYQTLKSLGKRLSYQQFMRVHRSYEVNKNKVKSLKGNDLFVENHEVPISETYQEEVKEIFFKNINT